MGKIKAKDMPLLITSILFVIGIFFGKWVCLVTTTIWLITVICCIYKMVCREYGSVGGFVSKAEETGAQNRKEGRKFRGAVEQGILPIIVIAGIGIACALLSLMLM